MKYTLVPPPLLLLSFLLLVPYQIDSQPLTTKSRWIVDDASGKRVKLRCANWPGHMEAVIPEGLSQKPVDDIAAKVAELGFNCIRLTWSIHMVSKPEYRNLTVSGSLSSLGLNDAVAGVEKNNPSIVNRTVIQAFDAVVGALGRAGVMVVLDNHVSKPMWCCGMDDGNGFFGDRYFDADEWQQGLQTMARRYVGVQAVVGMSLRNELRGQNASTASWYKYMAAGATAIHETNPDVLIIVSGLNYDCDLSFLRSQRFPVKNNKILYEAHWYVFSEGRQQEWASRSLNWLCSGMSHRFDYRIGYVNHQDNAAVAPLFLSEFGYDQRRVDDIGNKFMNCFMGFAARTDIDWALWALQGSYYMRDGQPGAEETYGVLDRTWDHPKDPNFMMRFRLLQDIIQDPESEVSAYQIIYHPLSGMCLMADHNNNIKMSDCTYRSRWNHDGDGTPIQLADTQLCLKLQGDRLPVALSTSCGDNQTMWKAASSAMFQMAGVDENGRKLCMDWSSANSSAVVTKDCLCLHGQYCSGDSGTQWFNIISSNVA